MCVRVGSGGRAGTLARIKHQPPARHGAFRPVLGNPPTRGRGGPERPVLSSKAHGQPEARGCFLGLPDMQRAILSTSLFAHYPRGSLARPKGWDYLLCGVHAPSIANSSSPIQSDAGTTTETGADWLP